ncbi:MAG: hypothetical protein GXO58_04075, partial [Thermodesulfobacteria bacterium]|nr:hypothetical protein [Thermodesulfobacteriota bacterium]
KDRISGRDKEKLMSFEDEAKGDEPPIPYSFKDYLELVDWAGRALRKEGRGYIKDNVPRLIKEIGMEPKGFLSFARSFLKEFGHAVGSPGALIRLREERLVRHLKGMRAARRVFVKKAA